MPLRTEPHVGNPWKNNLLNCWKAKSYIGYANQQPRLNRYIVRFNDYRKGELEMVIKTIADLKEVISRYDDID